MTERGAVVSSCGADCARILSPQPVTLSCGHCFCRGCAASWFTAAPKLCPVGRCPNTLYYNRVAGLGTSVTLQSLVDDVRQNGVCRCRFGCREGPHGEWEQDTEGCPWTGRASETDAHEATCTLKLVPCRWGCGLELLPREAATHDAACADTVVRCSFAGCNVEHRRRDASKHEKKAAELHARCEREVRLELGVCDEFVQAAAAVIARADKATDISRVVAAMQLCQQSADVSHQACAALAAIYYWEVEESACDAGAILAIVAAMKAHPGSADLLEEACWALGNITGITGKGNNKKLAADVGAIQAVVVAMQTHPDSADLQVNACFALSNITVGVANRVKARDAGAIEAVVAAMKTHPGSEDLQEYACSALGNITADVANRVKAGAAGAIEAVVAALCANPDSVDVLDNAFRALCHMVQGVANNAVKARGAGAAEAVVGAMRNHTDSAGVQESARLALAHLNADAASS